MPRTADTKHIPRRFIKTICSRGNINIYTDIYRDIYTPGYLAIAISIRRAARWTGDNSWPWQWRPFQKPFSKYNPKNVKTKTRPGSQFQKVALSPNRMAAPGPVPASGHPVPCCLCCRPTYLHNLLNISNFLLELSS